MVAGLLSWRHSGFSVQSAIRVEPWDAEGVERLGRYPVHPPIALGRLQYDGRGPPTAAAACLRASVVNRHRMGSDDEKLRSRPEQRVQQIAEVVVHGCSGSRAAEAADRGLAARVIRQGLAAQRPCLECQGPHHLEALLCGRAITEVLGRLRTKPVLAHRPGFATRPRLLGVIPLGSHGVSIHLAPPDRTSGGEPRP